MILLHKIKLYIVCFWKALILQKVNYAKKEKLAIKNNLEIYPIGSLGYQRLNLGIAISDFKIELWKAFGCLD